MICKEIEYGFEWGPVLVERCIEDANKGWVTLQVTTDKDILQLYVTKTGKIRIHSIKGVEWKKEKKGDNSTT